MKQREMVAWKEHVYVYIDFGINGSILPVTLTALILHWLKTQSYNYTWGIRKGKREKIVGKKNTKRLP